LSISIHLCTHPDLEATNAVVMAAFDVQSSRQEALRRYLALQPDGAFIAKENDSIVGFGAVMDYGGFAYVGLMSVHPGVQKRGIGRLILEQLLSVLDTRGCPTVLLDATPVGAALYEQYGFVDEDTTLVFRQTQPVQLSPVRAGGMFPLKNEDLPAVIAFDALYFGAERGNVLASYLADVPQRAFIVRDNEGKLAGYMMAQPAVLGPWLARSTEAAEQLLSHALTLPFESEPSVFVSAHHHDALAMLDRYGFRLQRSLRHMRGGQALPRARQTSLYGQISLGLG
jgi:GNAT superfamily N-acetyltransferase